MRKRQNGGYTLVEMMVSIAVFAIASLAISSIVVCAIRYSGLSYREEALLRETMTFERVLDAALENASEMKAYHLENKELKTISSGSLELQQNVPLMVVFPQKGATGEAGEEIVNPEKFVLIFLKTGADTPTKAWYYVEDQELTGWQGLEDTDVQEKLNALPLLSEDIVSLKITYTTEETSKILEFEMDLRKGNVEKTLHR